MAKPSIGFGKMRGKRLRLPRNEYESRKIQWERDPPLTMKELQELDRLSAKRKQRSA